MIKEPIKKQTSSESPKPIQTSKPKASYLDRFQRITAVDKILFTQHLGMMLRGGVSLSRALDILATQTKKKHFKTALLHIRAAVEKGDNLSDALEKYPNLFPAIFVSMIRAGESSGTLEETLSVLTQQTKKEHELVSKIKGALTYPVIVIFIMIFIGIGMIIFVIPRITDIFAETNAILPMPTRILIGISETIIQNGLLFGVGAVAVIALFIFAIKKPKGKKILDTVLLSSPIIGGIIQKIQIARFARNFSSLLIANLPIVQALELTGDTLNNSLYSNSIKQLTRDISKGLLLSEIMKQFPKLYPTTIREIIHVGEETGNIDSVLKELAEFYEEEISQIMENLPSILEPALMVLIGVGVGGMAVAIIMPMYSLSQQF